MNNKQLIFYRISLTLMHRLRWRRRWRRRRRRRRSGMKCRIERQVCQSCSFAHRLERSTTAWFGRGLRIERKWIKLDLFHTSIGNVHQVQSYMGVVAVGWMTATLLTLHHEGNILTTCTSFYVSLFCFAKVVTNEFTLMMANVWQAVQRKAALVLLMKWFEER